MKKLMFAAVAGLSLSAFAAIESSNIVGYTTTALNGDNTAKGAGACFVNVDNSDLTFGDVKVTGYSGTYEGGKIYARQLDAYGVGGKKYYWWDDGEILGWYDNEGEECYNEDPLPVGEGLWIYSPSVSFKLQSAGAVPKSPIEVTLRGSNTAKLVANPMPKTLTLGEITVTDGTDNGYEGGKIYARKLDQYGRGGTKYYWWDDGETVGWYDNEGVVSYNDVAVNPGEALWIYSPSTSYKMVFPAP